MDKELQTFRLFVAWVLVLLPFVDWTAVYLLRKAVKAKGEIGGIALKERLTVALFLATTVSLNAVLGVVVILGLVLPPGVGLAILATSLILVSAPNLYWLYLYGSNRFKK